MLMRFHFMEKIDLNHNINYTTCITTQSNMSWASVVKRKPDAEKPVETIPDEKQIEPLHYAVKSEQESLAESLAIIEKEQQEQCRPTWVRLRRPDAPQVTPIFKTRDEMYQWESDEFWKNKKHSDEVFEQRTQEWRIKNNWLLPPMKTTVSKDERTRGFYVANDTNHRNTAVVCYVTPFSTEIDLSSPDPINESMVDMIWCLIHSRSDELVACNTVADFKALFKRNLHLEPDLRHVHVYSRRKDTFPLKMLWLLSQKANVFPGKARHGTAHWTTDPCMTCPPFDPEVYSKSMVFFSSRKCRDSKNAIVIGQHGGREETGICVVQQLKQNGDAATIRWLLSATQLREMERVAFVPECSPFRVSIDYDSDCYGYDDEWI